MLLQGQPKREFRADVDLPPRAEPSGQLAGLFTQVVVGVAEAPDRRDPDLVADRRIAVLVPQVFQQQGGLGVVGHVVEGGHVRVPLHVRLAGEDEHLERLHRERVLVSPRLRWRCMTEKQEAADEQHSGSRGHGRVLILG